MASRMIEIKAPDGGKFSAYLALPESGSGPGLLLLGPELSGIDPARRNTTDYFAEEGYVALAPDLFWRMEPDITRACDARGFRKVFNDLGKFDLDPPFKDLTAAEQTLRALTECTGDIGVVGFSVGGTLAYLIAARGKAAVAVSFYGVGLPGMMGEAENIACPIVLHCPERDPDYPPETIQAIREGFTEHPTASVFVYPGADHGFYNSDRDGFDKHAATMAHTRTLAALRSAIGPAYDLGDLWDKHCEYEFVSRDVDRTMATMVAEPYVNHIPTMTGGVGHQQLHRFYLNHFVHANPDDTRLIQVSRTIGVDRVVDELVFCFTHTKEIDWMLPGIPPTGRYVEVPLVAIVSFRGDKLFHEHIYWDQASVLVQIGRLDPNNLPVAGQAATQKMMDASSLESNTLMARWKGSEPGPAK